MAGVVFEDYTMASVTMHMAVSKTGLPLKNMVFAVFQYAFVQLGVDKAIGLVNSSNKAALEVDLKLGFRPEAVVEGVFPNGDMVILVMNKSDCKWITAEQRAA